MAFLQRRAPHALMAGPAAKAQPAHRQSRAAAAGAQAQNFPEEAPGGGSQLSGSRARVTLAAGPGRAVLQRALLRRAGPDPRADRGNGNGNGPAAGTGVGMGTGRRGEGRAASTGPPPI